MNLYKYLTVVFRNGAHERFKEIRVLHGLNQHQVAKILEVSQSKISKIERDLLQPYDVTLNMLKLLGFKKREIRYILAGGKK